MDHSYESDRSSHAFCRRRTQELESCLRELLTLVEARAQEGTRARDAASGANAVIARTRRALTKAPVVGEPGLFDKVTTGRVLELETSLRAFKVHVRQVVETCARARDKEGRRSAVAAFMALCELAGIPVEAGVTTTLGLDVDPVPQVCQVPVAQVRELARARDVVERAREVVAAWDALTFAESDHQRLDAALLALGRALAGGHPHAHALVSRPSNGSVEQGAR